MEMSYNIDELLTLIRNEENDSVDRIVNTILADFLGLHFIYDEEDKRENFIKGFIADD